MNGNWRGTVSRSAANAEIWRQRLPLLAAARLAWLLASLTVGLFLPIHPAAAQQPRSAELVGADSPEPAHPRRVWSLAIGISDYLHSDRGISDLQFAAADAQAFDRMVASQQFAGHGAAAETRMLLTDKDATLANVRSALLDFLGKAGKDDMVVVLFAGHGAPDPLRPNDLYLLVRDTDPAKLASTALPMADVQRAFVRLRSDHVVFFADACHSAGIALPGVALRGGSQHNQIHGSFAEIGKLSRNRVVVTSSGADEKSFEGRKWGHGVFTWALLQAVAGQADAAGNQDGIVQLGEAIDFVRNAVERETAFAQHPELAGVVDGRLPLATVVAGPASVPPNPLPKPVPAPAKKAKPPLPLAKRPHIAFDFAAQQVRPLRYKPDVFFVLQRAAMQFEVPPAERAKLAKPVAEALDTWGRRQRELRVLAETTSAAHRNYGAKLADYGRQFSLPANASAADRAQHDRNAKTFCAAELAAKENAERQLDLARDQELAATRALRDLLAAELARDSSPLSGLPAALWVVLGQAEAELALAQEMAAMDERERLFAQGKDAPDPPPANLKPALAVLDAYLDRFAAHPWRARALYLRAYLACEHGTLDPLEVARQYLRVVAEAPDHPQAAELHLRIGLAYFDASDPRVQTLARDELLAALDRAPKGHWLRDKALMYAAWVCLRLDRRDEAARHMLAAIQEAAQPDDDSSGIVSDMQGLLAMHIFEDGDPGVVQRSALPAGRKAVIFGLAAQIAVEFGDFALGLSLAEAALALAPDDRHASQWDAKAAESELGLRQYAAAAARLAARYGRFGPTTEWYAKHRSRLPAEFSIKLTEDAQRAAEWRDKAAAAPVPATPAELFRPLPRRMQWMFGLCYGEALHKGRDPKGQIVLALEFLDDVGLSKVAVQADDTGDKGLGECLVRRVSAMRNPPRQNALLRVPLLFAGP